MCTLQNCHALYVYSEGTAELTRPRCVLRRHCTTATLYMYSEGNAKLPCTRRVFTRHCRNARNKCALCRTATLSTRTCTQKALQNCHVLKKCPWKILQNYHVLEMHSEGSAELPRWCVLGNLLECEKEEKFNNSFNKTCCYVTSLSMRQRRQRSHTQD